MQFESFLYPPLSSRLPLLPNPHPHVAMSLARFPTSSEGDEPRPNSDSQGTLAKRGWEGGREGVQPLQPPEQSEILMMYYGVSSSFLHDV